ncbi:hypothetical protein Taro_032486 [Colocasia esculenta]|uniref:t-SNARE coiled-coil homology domain-containing protein n=1 Tax=Colocasia esculenta TaxID=4460 RepID=A0A843VRH1_COLES|nr:hypothetical protein [Colocasia esculenta]
MMAEYKMPEEEVIERIISNSDSEDLLGKAIEEHGRGQGVGHHPRDPGLARHRHGDQEEPARAAPGASHYVKDKTKELKTAKQYQHSSRKWLCIGLLLLLILIPVIFIPIATSLSNC